MVKGWDCDSLRMAIQPGDTMEVSLNGVGTDKVVERVTFENRDFGLMVDITFHDGACVTAMADEIGDYDD